MVMGMEKITEIPSSSVSGEVLKKMKISSSFVTMNCGNGGENMKIITSSVTTMSCNRSNGDGVRRRGWRYNNIIPMTMLVIILLQSSTTTTMATAAAESVTEGHPKDILRLVNNGYEGLMVSFTEYVPHQHCNDLIHGLKIVLKELSVLMWEATGGRASLREVTVALPRTWPTDTLTCSLLTPLTTTAATPTNAHIRVTTNHPVFGSRPWVQQSQGCGRQGDYIQLGGDFLRNNHNNNRNNNNSNRNKTTYHTPPQPTTTHNLYTHSARLLLAEWVKFRWGVFEERGYPEDPLYPVTFRDPTTGVHRPNACPGRKPRPEPLPYCPKEAHIPEAPTKHNAQCVGRPAGDIILQSQDFTLGRNGPTNSTPALLPTLRFVQEGAARIVLVVEDTAVMNMQRRWEFVRKAVRRVVVYDIPDGDYVALVVFNSVARTSAPLSRMDSLSDVRQRVGSSLPRNPSPVPESNKCVLCGLQEAIRTLDAEPAGAVGATVILVTTGKGPMYQREVEEMERLATNRGVRVDTVLYPMTERVGSLGGSDSRGLQSLVSATHGFSFTVMDEGVGNDSKVSMMVALMDALLAAVRRSEPPAAPGAPVLIHSQGYPGGIASMSVGSFTLDDSLGPHVRLSIYYYDLNHVGNTVQLTTPSGETMSNVNMQEEDGDANVIFVNIPKAERGQWQYRVENRADSHQGLHIQVSGKESGRRKISLRVWTSATNNAINASDPSLPIIVYAEVKEEEMPIVNAKVTARLQRLGTDTNGSTYSSLIVDLFDNGYGDPDITGGDGVYSRYLPSLRVGGPGHYQLSVMADHNNNLAQVPVKDPIARSNRHRIYTDSTKLTCCGSSIRYEQLNIVKPFQRHFIYSVLEVVSQAPPTDMIPPSRILDLRASVNRTTREVALRWTAPGDDNDWGRPNHYEAVLATSWAGAKAFHGERVSGMPLPVQVYTQQVVFIYTNRYEEIVYIAIRAVDKAGNKGGVSNIVSVWVPRPPTTTVPPPQLFTSPHQHLQHTNHTTSTKNDPTVTQPVRLAGMNLEEIAVIVGSVGGFLVMAAVLATFCYCHVSRRRHPHHKQQQQESNEKMEGSSRNQTNRNLMMNKSNSNLVLNHQDNISHDSNDSITEKEGKGAVMAGGICNDGRPLSPIQSWGVTKLLQEHERCVAMTGGSIEATGTHHHNNLLQEQHQPFPPDVTLTGTPPHPHSSYPPYACSQALPTSTHPYPYATSQTPPTSTTNTTTHSDPPAYQPPYASSSTSYPPYQYPPSYSHHHLDEDLPPYTPTSQHSEMSSSYPTEPTTYPPQHQQPQTEMIQPVVSYSVVGGEMAYPPPMYTPPADDPPTPAPPVRSKVPPPVAPKPSLATRTVAANVSCVEPKRRNVTQV